MFKVPISVLNLSKQQTKEKEEKKRKKRFVVSIRVVHPNKKNSVPLSIFLFFFRPS